MSQLSHHQYAQFSLAICRVDCPIDHLPCVGVWLALGLVPAIKVTHVQLVRSADLESAVVSQSSQCAMSRHQ